jgi:NAD(P)-dependent dehydrogenase (short-subunit alcohol dehydrogenase family)
VTADPFRLDGRVAFVTGAGGGLGEGICTSLAAAGAAVACADIELERAEAIASRIEEQGGRSLALEVDVADSATGETAAQRTLAELGGVDVHVNKAAS